MTIAEAALSYASGAFDLPPADLQTPARNVGFTVRTVEIINVRPKLLDSLEFAHRPFLSIR